MQGLEPKSPDNPSIPVYNLVPGPGSPAEFGFDLLGYHVFLDATVRSDGDYGITEHVDNIPEVDVVANAITIGALRLIGAMIFYECAALPKITIDYCSATTGETPFLTVPTSCAGRAAVFGEPETLGTTKA